MMGSTARWLARWARAEYYVYDGDDVVLDFLDGDGTGGGGAASLQERYLFGPAVDQVLAQENVVSGAGQTVLWHLTDNLGSVRDLVRSDGTTAAHYQYDAFGNLLDGYEDQTRYQFTGRERDPDTGLQYNRARWYDPQSGQWLEEDPEGFSAGDANLRRYVGNGPTNATDASGQRLYPSRLRNLFEKHGYPNDWTGWIDAPNRPPNTQSRTSQAWDERRLHGFWSCAVPQNFIGPTNPPQLPPPIPPNYTKVPAKNGNGWVWQPPGATDPEDMRNAIRIMGPTKDYPSGYWRCYNKHGQPINPATGKPPANVSRGESNAQTHVPLPE